MSRRFECTIDGHYKYWEVLVEEDVSATNSFVLMTRHGKMGSAGRLTIKKFKVRYSADHKLNELVYSKIKKGYRKVPLRSDSIRERAAPKPAPKAAPVAAPIVARTVNQIPQAIAAAAEPAPKPAPDTSEKKDRFQLIEMD